MYIFSVGHCRSIKTENSSTEFLFDSMSEYEEECDNNLSFWSQTLHQQDTENDGNMCYLGLRWLLL
jgi:hypothetical protein